MPKGDRTGRSGLGPKTGRGMGFCVGYEVPGYANTESAKGIDTEEGHGLGCGRGKGRAAGTGNGLGMGRGMGRGIGRGMANRYGAARVQTGPIASQKPSSDDVKRNIESLEKELSALRDTLASLTKEKES